MNKKILISLLSVAIIGTLAYILYSAGMLSFKTIEEEGEATKTVLSVDALENNRYYVWHNENESGIKEDLNGTAHTGVFLLCPAGDTNWDKDSMIDHTVWFTSSNDSDIPTLRPGDELLYISPLYVPYDGINWERYADFGYTIGVANMVGDNSGHYRIINSEGKGYKGYIYPASDANVLNQYTNISNLFLDKIGGVPIRDEQITDGGTVSGLEKDKKYVCEWYTGTYYQDYEMRADIHTFCHMESFTTYDYEFLHSNCISVTIPDWLKTGYYYVDGIGFFRYVSRDDEPQYNGTAYDAAIDWNDPIVIYDEDGNVLYDPITGKDARTETSVTQDTEQDTDEGAESYETISDEIPVRREQTDERI